MPPSIEPSVSTTVPEKDPIVDRVYDYTKWHIALYGAVLGVLAGGVALGKTLPTYLLVSIGFLVVAAVAAGTLASSLSRRERWEGFLQTKTFPLIPDSRNVGLTMQCWLHIQHAGIWAAILCGVIGAIVIPSSDKSSTPWPSPCTNSSTPTPKPSLR
jgi:uncharacterized membrane protein YeaQ/YmgE (transglycosylase-associated protein family)